MNEELLRQVAQVLIQWGLGLIIFGAVTILIGFIIIACLDIKTIRSVRKFLNN